MALYLIVDFNCWLHVTHVAEFHCCLCFFHLFFNDAKQIIRPLKIITCCSLFNLRLLDSVTIGWMIWIVFMEKSSPFRVLIEDPLSHSKLGCVWVIFSSMHCNCYWLSFIFIFLVRKDETIRTWTILASVKPYNALILIVPLHYFLLTWTNDEHIYRRIFFGSWWEESSTNISIHHSGIEKEFEIVSCFDTNCCKVTWQEIIHVLLPLLGYKCFIIRQLFIFHREIIFFF